MVPRGAEHACRAGQRQRKGKQVTAPRSQEMCCGLNTDASFYLLLSSLAGTHILICPGEAQVSTCLAGFVHGGTSIIPFFFCL